jgi:hypothetical protein
MEYLWPLYSVWITIVMVLGKQILSARPPTWRANCQGSLPLRFSTVGSKFLSIACRTRMVSAKDNGVYTGLASEE